MEMEKKMYSKQMLAEPSLIMEHREDFHQKGLAKFLTTKH